MTTAVLLTEACTLMMMCNFFENKYSKMDNTRQAFYKYKNTKRGSTHARPKNRGGCKNAQRPRYFKTKRFWGSRARVMDGLSNMTRGGLKMNDLRYDPVKNRIIRRQ